MALEFNGNAEQAGILPWTGDETWSGATITRVTSPAPDDGSFSYRAFVPTDSAARRAEYAWYESDEYEGQEKWYHVAVRLPSGWVNPNGWAIFTQFHSDPSLGSPPLSLNAVSAPQLRMAILGGKLEYPSPGNFRVEQTINRFYEGILVKDVWHQFLLHVRWSAQAIGFVELFHRQRGGGNFVRLDSVTNIKNLYVLDGVTQPNYWKAGLYRGDGASHELFFDSCRRGAIRSDVDFGFTGEPPPPPSPTPALTITTTSLPNGQAGVAYNVPLEAAGGSPPYTWFLFSSSLPDGLGLTFAGDISGTPRVVGTFSFTVLVRDAVGTEVTRALSITLAAAAPAPAPEPSVLPFTGNTPTAPFSFTLSSDPFVGNQPADPFHFTVRAAEPAPPPPIEPVTWTLVLADSSGVPISTLSAIATERSVSARLNRPVRLSFRVPSGDDRIAGLHTDGRPRLAKLRRTVKGYRRERQDDGTLLNVLRLDGVVWQLEDDGDPDTAHTLVTCFDPLQRLSKRYTAAFREFKDVQGSQIAKTLVDEANAVAATGLTTVGGTFETTPLRTVSYQRKRVAEALVELASAFNGFDLFVEPLDQTDGTLARLSCLARRGSFRPHVVFGWGIAPDNVQRIRNFEDAETAATQLTGLGATNAGADQLVSSASNASLEAEIGRYEEISGYPDITSKSFLDALVAEELQFRGEGRQLVTIVPQPGRTPLPWTHWDVGDTFAVYAGERLRGGFQGIQRCYGFDLAIDDEGVERVTSIIASPE